MWKKGWFSDLLALLLFLYQRRPTKKKKLVGENENDMHAKL